jgi:hypothetical protein
MSALAQIDDVRRCGGSILFRVERRLEHIVTKRVAHMAPSPAAAEATIRIRSLK